MNRIDVKALLEKGQKDGAVQFAVAVSPDGNAIETWTYRPMPECDALEQEVMKRLEDAKFTPPIYNYQPAAALLYGTVIFSPDASPRLRVLLNQDPEEIKATSDFIAPQPVIGGASRFVGLHPPELPIPVEGIVDVELDVDVKGNLQDIKLVTEDPPLVGFREAVARDLSGAKFIPAFRDGDATKSAATMSVCYKAAEFDTQPDLEAPGLELGSSPSESIAPAPSPE